MAGERFSGVALGSIAAGGIFVYAGIKGYSVPQTIRALISGKSPAGQAQAAPVSGSVAASAGGTGAGSAVSTSGLPGYVGHCYFYGGAPGTDGKGCWDCSSFANWYVGHDLGRAIPGDAHYDGSSHGPATGSWLTWSGCTTVTAADAQAGDLVVWSTHMGVYLGGGQMISALNPSLGTMITSVAGGSPGGEGPGTYRRLN